MTGLCTPFAGDYCGKCTWCKIQRNPTTNEEYSELRILIDKLKEMLK